MPARFLAIIGFVLISFGAATQVSAELFWGFFSGVVRDVKSRQCWPEPYTYPDREAVRSPFCTMVANGWQRQNMLGEYYFKPGTAELNEAGRKKVRWILTVCPAQHRLIFVHAADSKEDTLARRAAVVQLARQIAPDDLPPVLLTSISEDGWSAEQADLIGREYLKSIPEPRLPVDTNQNSTNASD